MFIGSRVILCIRYVVHWFPVNMYSLRRWMRWVATTVQLCKTSRYLSRLDLHKTQCSKALDFRRCKRKHRLQVWRVLIIGFTLFKPNKKQTLCAACYRLNLCAACYRLNLCAACYRLNLCAACYRLNLCAACYRLNLCAACYRLDRRIG